MLNNLLFYRLMIFNTLAIAAAAYVFVQGHANFLITDHTQYIFGFMGVFFLSGLWGTFVRGSKLSNSINYLKSGKIKEYDMAQFRLHTKKLGAKSQYIHNIANWLVAIGLMGNAYALVIAFKGADVGNLESLVGSLADGMVIAFGSTLIGTGLGFWTELNYSMLKSATDAHVEDAIAA